mgnify:FL=1
MENKKLIGSIVVIVIAVIAGYFLLRTQQVSPQERLYSSFPFTAHEGKFTTSLFSFDYSFLPPEIGLLEMEQSNSIICKHYFDAIFVNQSDQADYASEIDIMGRSMRCNPMPLEAMTVTQKSMRDRLMTEYGYSALEAESVVAFIPTFPGYTKVLSEGEIDQNSLYFTDVCSHSILDTNHTGVVYIMSADCDTGGIISTMYIIPNKEKNQIIALRRYTSHLSEQVNEIIESFTWK